MPVITIQQSPRDVELKRRLAASVTAAVVDVYRLHPDQVHIYFDETSNDNWARGGVLAADRPSDGP
jgi:4-oxalocrotonate tautomerase